MDASFIKEQLELLDGDVKVLFKGEYALVQCPFHKQGQETHPSMMVNIDNTRYSVGFCFCMSCGEKGDWNKIAEALGMEEVAVGNKSMKSFSVRSLELKPPVLKKSNSLEASWLPNTDWRGISGKVLSELKAKSLFNSTTKEKQIVLPVTVVGEVVGNINCSLVKKPKEKGSSYTNSQGPWVKRALFPFDYSLFLANHNSNDLPVFIVEGPRDALNLIQHDIPALAILGTQNWSKESIPLLTLFKKGQYIILMDGDEAGAKAAENIYKDLINVFPKKDVRVCALPKGKDPADLTLPVINWMKDTYKG